MERLTLLSIIFLSFFFCTTIQAQLSLGAGATFGTQINNGMGVQFKANYDFERPWGISADYTHYFDGYDWTFSDRVTELNVNAHCRLTNEDSHFVYALFGYNYTMAHIPVFDAFSTSEVGWNVGLGGEFEVMKQVRLFVEVKQIIGDAKQFSIAVGGIYEFPIKS